MRTYSSRGYVLLIVLVTLTLASVALAQLATRALQENTQSLGRLKSLQSRWGRISCQKAILPRASKTFELLEANQTINSTNRRQPAPAVLSESIRLGDQTFTLILADENAKLNLNTQLNARRKNAAGEALRRLLKPNYFLCAKNLSSVQTTASLASWGEVFELTKLRELDGSSRGLAEATRQITLWGTGKLNIRRAPDSVIEAACKSVVTDGLARRVVERIGESNTLESKLVLQQTIQNIEDQALLSELLGDGSTAFSLWIENTTPSTRSQHFAVQYSDETGRVTTHEVSIN